jgi:DsbC/DsbD-like thiol-disulfide interchange protein
MCAKRKSLPGLSSNRWWRIAPLLAVCLAWLCLGGDQNRIHLVLSAETARAGDTVWAGLQMDMPPTWHVYWRNGGDAGIPVSIAWTLPDGVSAGPSTGPFRKRRLTRPGTFR